MGKWRYAPYYDVFIGLQDINDGDIWIYKPVGWVQPNPPGNALPTRQHHLAHGRHRLSRRRPRST